jgi:hypothetical protein
VNVLSEAQSVLRSLNILAAGTHMITDKLLLSTNNVTRSQLGDSKTKQLQSYGHVQRMEEGKLTKEVMKWHPPGRRK